MTASLIFLKPSIIFSIPVFIKSADRFAFKTSPKIFVCFAVSSISFPSSSVAFSASFNLSLFSFISPFKFFIWPASSLASVEFLPCSKTTFLYSVCNDLSSFSCSEILAVSFSRGDPHLVISEFTSLKFFSIFVSSVSALLSDVLQLFVRLSFSPYFSLASSSAPFKVAIFSFWFLICSFKTLLCEDREETDLLFFPNSAVTLPISEAKTFKSEFICDIAFLYSFSPSSFIVPPNVFELDISTTPKKI